jgi:hypothetical protein
MSIILSYMVNMHTQDIQMQSTCQLDDYLKYTFCIFQVFLTEKNTASVLGSSGYQEHKARSFFRAQQFLC